MQIPDIAELRRLCQRGAANPFWLSRNVMAWPSIYLTRLALLLGVTANTVTMVSVLSSVVGSLGFLSTDPRVRLAGCALILWGYLLDLVDGEVARFRTGRGTLDASGMFADYVGHVLHNPLLFVCWSVGVYLVTGASVALWLTPLLLMGAQAAPLLAKQVILVDLLRRGVLDSSSPEFIRVAIDKPGEQGLSDALGGDIVERPGLRAALSQVFGYPGPLVILPAITIIADYILPTQRMKLLVGCQMVFAVVYAINLPRTLRRNFLYLRELRWLHKPVQKV